MKLKEVKRPPLLSPPSEQSMEWARPTESDFSRIKFFLMEVRGLSEGLHVAATLRTLQDLGKPDELRPADVKAIGETLEDFRRGHNGAEIASIHFDSTALGLTSDITGADRRDMLRELSSSRLRGDYSTVARMLFKFKALGIARKGTEKDEEGIKRQLEEQRKHHNGAFIAHMHTWMMGIGMPSVVSDWDKEDMRACLELVRGPGLAQNLVELLGSLAEIRSQERGLEKQEMPQLKRFGGVR